MDLHSILKELDRADAELARSVEFMHAWIGLVYERLDLPKTVPLAEVLERITRLHQAAVHEEAEKAWVFGHEMPQTPDITIGLRDGAKSRRPGRTRCDAVHWVKGGWQRCSSDEHEFVLMSRSRVCEPCLQEAWAQGLSWTVKGKAES